jgi:hypothetical protein
MLVQGGKRKSNMWESTVVAGQNGGLLIRSQRTRELPGDQSLTWSTTSFASMGNLNLI